MFEDGSTGYRKFWTELLSAARERTDLHAYATPRNDWYIGASRSGITYNYALRKNAAYVELWIDKGVGSEEANESIFQELLAHKDEIETAFGDRLIWHRARGRSRAVQFFASDYGFDDHGRWPEIQKALIDAMIRLEGSCSPHLYGESRRVVTSIPAAAFEASTDIGSRPIDITWTEPVEKVNTVITMPNLEAGIAEFRRRWPSESDFHNRLYRELNTRRDAGRLTWERLVDELSTWKALRTSLSGQSKEWYLERGEKPFRHMLVIVAHVRSAHAGHDPDITETRPEELRELFDVSMDIKGASSPMFASKLCHFLLPPAFPVADQGVLGISTVDGYWQYWKHCAEGWRASEEKEALKARLRDEMGTTPFVGYPWAVKIAELCHSGARHPRN